MQINIIGNQYVQELMDQISRLGAYTAAHFTLPFENIPKDGLNVLLLSSEWQSEIQHIGEKDQFDMLLSPVSDPGLMRQALKLNIKDFLLLPIDDAELRSAIEHTARAREKELNSGLKGACTTSVFINAKGGAGATFIASNVAQELAQKFSRATTFVDLDLQFGSAANYLDITPKNSLISALNAAADLDEYASRGYLTKHYSSLNFLSAKNSEIPLLEEINAQSMEQLIANLKQISEHLILDLPRQFSLLTIAALQQTDKIFIVLQQNLSHLADASKLLRVFRKELYVDEKQINVIVNRYSPKDEITTQDIADALKMDVSLCVRNDFRLATSSLNEAQPIYNLNKGSKMCEDLSAITHHITGETMSVEQSFIKKLLRA